MEAKKIIEALLFCSKDPIPLRRLRRLLPKETPISIRNALSELRHEYERETRSFQLIEVAGGYQLTTRPEYIKVITRFFRKRRPRLSLPALETVTIIAYKQPVTRAEIEKIRGVGVEGVLDTLLDRNLVKIAGRAKKPGAPLLYRTTREFLRYFGLRSLSDLPKFELLSKREVSLDLLDGPD
nr:MAG: hypothetical protein AM324_04785 [Candidatus Thorarchaeota archaeon SMTZ1-83]